MTQYKPLIVIPVRMSASRLPNKPMAMIGDKPMIVHSLERALEAGFADVIVAAAEVEVIDAVTAVGGRAVLTDPNLPSGTDRVAAAVEECDPNKNYTHIINYQGDIPFLPPEYLRLLFTGLDLSSRAVRTIVTQIVDPYELTTDSVVKAHVGFKTETVGSIGRAISFSRLPIPWGHGPYWHHIGVYGYPREVLETFVTLPPTVLELRERLEQLRIIEHGFGVDAVVVDKNPPVSVDTPSDLEQVRAQWKRMSNH